MHIDYQPPFEWKIRPPTGRHTIEAYAYDKLGNLSKAITDIFVLK